MFSAIITLQSRSTFGEHDKWALPIIHGGGRKDVLMNIAQLCHQESGTATQCSLDFNNNEHHNCFSYIYESVPHFEILRV